MLERQEMFRREKKSLPSLGVQGGRLLLANKRNHLRGAPAKYVEGKDACLPTLQSTGISTLKEELYYHSRHSLLNS